MRRDAFSALSTIKNKLDARTIAAYNRKIDDTNRKDMLEKYINAFKVINTKKTEEIITIKKIKQEKKENKEKIQAKDAEFKANKKELLKQLKEKTYEQKFKTEEKEKRKKHKQAISGLYRQ